jgi:hypothetical protein
MHCALSTGPPATGRRSDSLFGRAVLGSLAAMAEISAEDLKPLVYQYLVKTGLSKAAKAFAKEAGQVRGVRALRSCGSVCV